MIPVLDYFQRTDILHCTGLVVKGWISEIMFVGDVEYGW